MPSGERLFDTMLAGQLLTAGTDTVHRCGLDKPAERYLQQTSGIPQYRACFRPPDGRAFVKAELSMTELWVAAELSGDEQMIAAILQGLDLPQQGRPVA